ncbi:MAG TPA: rod shape-determining protein MreD [Geobacteraceae bacterium]|nr:rod shape-determining protein MreD [Geobacteraceae bacterium]
MIRSFKIFIIVFTALILQVTILPYYLADPFKPNLLIIVVAYMGLNSGRTGGVLAFILGLLQDCFSGIYFGLNGFSYLCVHLLLNMTADRLYTDSRYLMVLVVFLATIVNGLLHLLLLLIFPNTNGVYVSVLSGLLPQGLVNALVASLVFISPALKTLEDGN